MKVKYPEFDPKVRRHWVSKATGEIVPTFKDAMRVAFAELCNLHVVNVIWTYSKKGW